jgi:hypothetical protein
MPETSQMLSLLELKGLQIDTLVEHLDETFPPVNPTPSDELPSIMYRSGQRSVVEWIINNME